MMHINRICKLFMILISICVVISMVVLFFLLGEGQDVKTIKVSTVSEFCEIFELSECRQFEKFNLINANNNDNEEFVAAKVELPWTCLVRDRELGIVLGYPSEKGGIIINDLYHTTKYPVAQMMITRNVNESISSDSGDAIINITKQTSITHLLELIRFVKRIGHYRIAFSLRDDEDYSYYEQFQIP